MEENGKPLAAKNAVKEEERYETAVAERKRMSLVQKRGFFHKTFNFSFPLCCLATLFDNRVVREETLHGRKTIVVESTPRPGARPADEAGKTAFHWKETTWIDVEDEVPLRLETVALDDVAHVLPGSTVHMDWQRLEPRPGDPDARPVWVEEGSIARIQMKMLFFTGRGTTEQPYSNYRKFRVDVRLLDDSVKVVP